MKIPTIVVSPQRTKPDRAGFPTLSWSMLLVPNMVLCLAELRKEEGAQPVSDSRSGGGDPELTFFARKNISNGLAANLLQKMAFIHSMIKYPSKKQYNTRSHHALQMY